MHTQWAHSSIIGREADNFILTFVNIHVSLCKETKV